MNNPVRFADPSGHETGEGGTLNGLRDDCIERGLPIAYCNGADPGDLMGVMGDTGGVDDRGFGVGNCKSTMGNVELFSCIFLTLCGVDKDDPVSSAINIGLRGHIVGGGASAKGAKLPWLMWGQYEKVVYNGVEYAKIGGRLYTQHAVERMMPSGLGMGGAAAKLDAPRSVAPEFVEMAIETGTATTYERNGVVRTMHTSGNLQVVTEEGGKIVVTVITTGR